MINILIIDDSIDKITALTELIYKKLPNSNIDTSENIFNSLVLLKKKTYNLTIIDINLPLKSDEIPISDGGKLLLKEIYRLPNIFIPNYIIGFSQYENSNFSNIWKTIKYSNSSITWQSEINLLLKHISSTKLLSSQSLEETKPTVFLEGLTDKCYLNKAIELFYPEIKDKLILNSQNNAGANWVTNQIPIWALKKQKDTAKNYIKAVGLLDSDEAGLEAKKSIKNRGLSDTEEKCYKIIHVIPKFYKEVLEFYQKGCPVEVEIESLFPLSILKEADSNGWLEYRPTTFSTLPKDWEQHKITSLDYIKSKEIKEDLLVYAKKVKFNCKQKFMEMVISKKDTSIFNNFKPLLKDILTELSIIHS